jgi:hypothetical protein
VAGGETAGAAETDGKSSASRDAILSAWETSSRLLRVVYLKALHSLGRVTA